MTTKKRLFVIAAGGAVCILGVGTLALAWGFGFFGEGSRLSVYKLEQTASSHAGYLRTTLTHGNDVYVNDFEEAALRLTTSEPALPRPLVESGTIRRLGAEVIEYQIALTTRSSARGCVTSASRATRSSTSSSARTGQYHRAARRGCSPETTCTS